MTTPICPNCGSTNVHRHGGHSTCGQCNHTGLNVWFTRHAVRPERIRAPILDGGSAVSDKLSAIYARKERIRKIRAKARRRPVPMPILSNDEIENMEAQMLETLRRSRFPEVGALVGQSFPGRIYN